jgi:pimeloyl-ACP methyl ester carboxylesterase
MSELALTLVGAPLGQFAERFPSWAVGAWRQSVACFDEPATFQRTGGPAVLLVPGLFCTPSVMNRLGHALEALGADCHLVPKAYPHVGGFLANTCRLEHAARLLLDDLARLRWVHGVEEVTLVGHSNGAMISLLALDTFDSEPRALPTIRGVVTLAGPFGGSPFATWLTDVVPACRDVTPRSVTLARVARQAGHVRLALAAGRDLLVPTPEGARPGPVPFVVLPGFQHMDFIVGSEAQIAETAELIAGVLPSRKRR